MTLLLGIYCDKVLVIDTSLRTVELVRLVAEFINLTYTDIDRASMFFVLL